ncbi:MAG: hypothetical protein HWQ38_09770 [Nostoc sp. NMS7]|uniref:hypothetical protein n=1 Tax=Nostoc sp. NMS7 TaxID=2815391 RepID=UPI0025F92195|nr:hypothetical protein [Nostoc sp. NMS7]MBN3946757.1 hypothetical protein [Nostoc sp. NMS7]
MTKRIINLGGGSYHAHIEGNYVQGKDGVKERKVEKSAQVNDGEEEVINTNGANYVENLGGKVIGGDVIVE